jgi:hypothetical protein
MTNSAILSAEDQNWYKKTHKKHERPISAVSPSKVNHTVRIIRATKIDEMIESQLSYKPNSKTAQTVSKLSSK